jgi:hypothetical protein
LVTHREVPAASALVAGERQRVGGAGDDVAAVLIAAVLIFAVLIERAGSRGDLIRRRAGSFAAGRRFGDVRAAGRWFGDV